MLDNDVSLTLARLADAAAIARMSRALIEHGLEWSWTPQRVAASVRSRRANVVVARDGDRIAGFGIMRYGDEDAHLDLLGVAVDYQRRGLGRRLVEWLEKPALLGGISVVLLEVRQRNQTGQVFYERLGYRKAEIIEGYYQRLESAVRMRHDLGVRG